MGQATAAARRALREFEYGGEMGISVFEMEENASNLNVFEMEEKDMEDFDES